MQTIDEEQSCNIDKGVTPKWRHLLKTLTNTGQTKFKFLKITMINKKDQNELL